jgi:hypothetical protein
MLTAPTNRSEQLIYQKRAQEQKLSNMQTKLKQEFHQAEFAKWQNKSKNIEINYQVKQKLAALREQSTNNLNNRRFILFEVDPNSLLFLKQKTECIAKKLLICKKLQNKLEKEWLREWLN